MALEGRALGQTGLSTLCYSIFWIFNRLGKKKPVAHSRYTTGKEFGFGNEAELRRLDELSLAVIAHVLDHLGSPAREVTFLGLEFAVDELVV